MQSDGTFEFMNVRSIAADEVAGASISSNQPITPRDGDRLGESLAFWDRGSVLFAGAPGGQYVIAIPLNT